MPAKPKAKAAPDQGELIPNDVPPRWSVITTESGEHRLLFGKTIQDRDKLGTDRHLRRLRGIADFCNSRGLKPRPAVQCLADENGSLDAALRKQTKRAHKLQEKELKAREEAASRKATQS